MINTIFNRAMQSVLIAVTASSFLQAEDAAKEAPKEEPKTAPMTAEEIKKDASYAVGYSSGSAFAENFSQHGVNLDDFDMEIFMKGYSAASKGKKPEVDEKKLQAAMMGLSEIIKAREKTLGAENLKSGTEFLEKNGKREGVTINKSGLQYEVLVKGGSEKYVAPAADKESNKLFMVNYKGTKIDGTIFDESPVGQPVAMDLQVIEGFREALTSMPVGAKWKLFIPGSMAYGEQRASADLGPNTTLIFELELLEIKDAPPQQALPEGFQIPGGE